LTNLIFKFGLPSSITRVDEHVSSMMAAVEEHRVEAWDLATFETYFNENRLNFQ